MNLEAIVRDYLRRFHKDAESELQSYANQPTFEQAVVRAARAERADGKRHSHQCKIARTAMPQVMARLTGALCELRAAASFEELLATIDALIGSIHGIGPLFVYDAALRIGAFLRLEPATVYVHCGVVTGAVQLGFPSTRTRIEMAELPAELRVLKPYQVEDILCIYKGILGRMKARETSSTPRGCGYLPVPRSC